MLLKEPHFSISSDIIFPSLLKYLERNFDMKAVATCQIYIRLVRKGITHCELFFPLCDHSLMSKIDMGVINGGVVVIRINIPVISIMTL